MWGMLGKWLAKGLVWAVHNPQQLDQIIETAKRLKGRKQGSSGAGAPPVPTPAPVSPSDLDAGLS